MNEYNYSICNARAGELPNSKGEECARLCLFDNRYEPALIAIQNQEHLGWGCFDWIKRYWWAPVSITVDGQQKTILLNINSAIKRLSAISSAFNIQGCAKADIMAALNSGNLNTLPLVELSQKISQLYSQSPENCQTPPAQEETDARPLPPAPYIIKRYRKYTAVYDTRQRNPVYVRQTMTPADLEEIQSGTADRKKCSFTVPEGLPSHLRASSRDYHGTHRGHMAPAEDCRVDQSSVAESFNLVNICPQHPGFNLGYWKKMEKYVRKVASIHKVIDVYTGPLYLPKTALDGGRFVSYPVIGQHDLAVPTHFFKVLILEREDGQIDYEAYILPNEPIDKSTLLEGFRTTLKCVEKASGIFFSKVLPLDKKKKSRQKKTPTSSVPASPKTTIPDENKEISALIDKRGTTKSSRRIPPSLKTGSKAAKRMGTILRQV